MDSLQGKVVIITGSSTGIGAAAAVEFAKYGAKIVITGRDEAGMDKTKERCRTAGLPETDMLVIKADVFVDEDLRRLVDQTVEKFGKLDVLINNAGMGENKRFEDMTMEAFDRVFAVNARAVALLTKLCVPYLKKTKGTIINNSSMGATMPMENLLPYCMTKAAVDMMTKCLMLELGRYGIRVNSVNPGTIETDIFKKSGVQDVQKYYDSKASCYPLGRTGLPEEVAKVMVFLASDLASYVTGSMIPIDGGAVQTMSICKENLDQQRADA